MDERSPMWPLYNWIYKDLSMSCDQKVMMLLPSMEKCLSTSITELFLLLKFDNSSSLVIQNKALSGDYELMISLPPEAE